MERGNKMAGYDTWSIFYKQCGDRSSFYGSLVEIFKFPRYISVDFKHFLRFLLPFCLVPLLRHRCTHTFQLVLALGGNLVMITLLERQPTRKMK